MPPSTSWRKSTFSQGGGSDCVEVAFGAVDVMVRDSKDATGPILDVPEASWRQFVAYSSLRK
jgi:uncharacterized protein DUF397